MENGAVYRPTTEVHPGTARDPRSRLAACCFLGRLKWPRRTLKILQLVSPGQGWESGSWAISPWIWEAAAPPLLNLVVQEAAVSTPPVPSLSAWGGGRYPPPPTHAAERPLIPKSLPGGVPEGDLGPPSMLGRSRKCVGGDLSETYFIHSSVALCFSSQGCYVLCVIS